MVRVKMDLSRANQASVFCVTFFGLEFCPNYTELHCLVFNACDGKHVYIVFIFILLYTFAFFIGFEKRGELSLHIVA
jgi:hypothetical protein